jgi:hypothetical protein
MPTSSKRLRIIHHSGVRIDGNSHLVLVAEAKSVLGLVHDGTTTAAVDLAILGAAEFI